MLWAWNKYSTFRQVVGNNLTFDFTNEEHTDSMMPNLVRELGNRGRYKIQELSESKLRLNTTFRFPFV